jgi:hypothetical protein
MNGKSSEVLRNGVEVFPETMTRTREFSDLITSAPQDSDHNSERKVS